MFSLPLEQIQGKGKNEMEMLEIMETMKGFKSVRDARHPADWDTRRDQLEGLIENRDKLVRHKHEYLLKEVMTTEDFPVLFGDSLDRELLARYKIAEPNFLRVLKRTTASSVYPRPIRRMRYDGLTCRLQKVKEKGEYKAAELDEQSYSYYIYKWGRQCDFSWETLFNDDLGAFNDVPQRFADAVTNTLEFWATDLFWNVGGPSAAMFGNTPANTALTINALETAVEAMAVYRDPKCAEPISNRPKYLVVPPGLEFTARQILNSTHKMWIDQAGGAAAGAYPTTNVIGQYGLELIVNPWITFIDTTSTPILPWALFADPNDIRTGEIGFLKGHETPEVYMKSSDQVRVGGSGLTSPFDGDFATDDVYYKVKMCFGGRVMDTRGNWAAGAVTP